MKHLLLTTTLATFALSGAMTGAVHAQTQPAINAPDGFTHHDSQLTADSLLGATIYDSAGDAIGAVADLVFDLNTTTDAAGMTQEGIQPAGTTHEGMNLDALDGAEAAGRDGVGGEQVVPGTNDAVNGVGGGTPADPATNAAAQADATPPADRVAPAGTPPTEGNTANATVQDANPDDPQVHGGTADQANTDVDGSDMDGDGTLDNGTGTMTTSPDVAAAHEGIVPADGAATGGQITHAVLDVGGFLGMGQHRIAIPIEDLTVYASGDEMRVYLPWTRDQLEALPVYDPADPATLGTSPWHMAN